MFLCLRWLYILHASLAEPRASASTGLCPRQLLIKTLSLRYQLLQLRFSTSIALRVLACGSSDSQPRDYHILEQQHEHQQSVFCLSPDFTPPWLCLSASEIARLFNPSRVSQSTFCRYNIFMTTSTHRYHQQGSPVSSQVLSRTTTFFRHQRALCSTCYTCIHRVRTKLLVKLF